MTSDGAGIGLNTVNESESATMNAFHTSVTPTQTGRRHNYRLASGSPSRRPLRIAEWRSIRFILKRSTAFLGWKDRKQLRKRFSAMIVGCLPAITSVVATRNVAGSDG